MYLNFSETAMFFFKILKKYPFTLAIGITPPQAAERFDEEFGLTEEEKKEKPMHIIMVVPEEQFKEINNAGFLPDCPTKFPILSMNPIQWITPVDLLAELRTLVPSGLILEKSIPVPCLYAADFATV